MTEPARDRRKRGEAADRGRPGAMVDRDAPLDDPALLDDDAAERFQFMYPARRDEIALLYSDDD